jgi:hypothetical protein
MAENQASAQARANARSSVSALVPEPKLVERVIHGQRVMVKVFPAISDPAWSGWVREVLTGPMDLLRVVDQPLD